MYKINFKGDNLKKILKYLIIILTILIVIAAAGFFAFQQYYHKTSYEEFEAVDTTEQTEEEKEQSELDEKYAKLKRVNILVAGIEGERTDTLMVFSYDKESIIDIISVPRDTYVDYGYKDAGRKKINAVYGYPDNKGGIKATANAVSKVLSVPIHEYISVDYDGVKEVVDAIDGVEVDIPFNMRYDDPYAQPPLHINLKKGTQVLDGEKAIQFLRWRKNNSGSLGAEGDLGRIKRQQEFVIAAIKKAIQPSNLTSAITIGLKNTKTSMDLKEAMYFASKLANIKDENINAYSVVGEDEIIDGIWYFKHDAKSTKELVRNLYLGIKPKIEDGQD